MIAFFFDGGSKYLHQNSSMTKCSILKDTLVYSTINLLFIFMIKRVELSTQEYSLSIRTFFSTMHYLLSSKIILGKTIRLHKYGPKVD